MSYLNTIPFYVYKIVCKPTEQYYFGSRYSHSSNGIQPEDDLWKKYFTSSLLIKDLLRVYDKNQFEATIVQIFDDKNETFWYEQTLIKEHIDDPLCLNLNFVNYREGRRISIPAGLKVWTHSITRKRRYSNTSPGVDWCLGGGGHTNFVAYHNKDNKIKYFDSDPGEEWTKGFGNLCRMNSIAYGNSYNLNKLWWNNGEQSVMRQQCPGDAWKPGRLSWTTKTSPSQAKRAKISHANNGKKAYNNGDYTIMRKEHPGPEWVEGVLPNMTTMMKRSVAKRGKPSNTKGKHWWNNGSENKLAEICPGVDWIKGRLL